MFSEILIWLRSKFFGRKTKLTNTRLDEFHRATYEELLFEAWNLVAGKPPVLGKYSVNAENYRNYTKDLRVVGPSPGARIEFNDKGEGRVIANNNCGLIEISLNNLPVRAVVDTNKWQVRLSNKERNELWRTKVLSYNDDNTPRQVGIEISSNPDTGARSGELIRVIGEDPVDSPIVTLERSDGDGCSSPL